MKTRTVPYRCPICDGHGIVPGGFYETIPGCTGISSSASEPCRQCINGIIYVPECETDNGNIIGKINV